MRSGRRSVFKYGNEVRLLQDGREAYPAMLAAIEAAERTINLETYILRSDGTGERFAKALGAAAARGVQVNVLYDALGSWGIDGGFLSRLRGGGVRMLAFHPFFSRLRHSFRRRNHRKTLVIDGKLGFAGGMNIGDEYASPEDGGQGWRDNMVMVRGPAVRDLQGLFVSTWNRHRGDYLAGPAHFPRLDPVGDAFVRVLGNNRRRQRRAIRGEYFYAIKRAERSVVIENSYFIPDRGLRRVLRNAGRRGVEVAILTAGQTDVKAVQWAGRYLYQPLLRAGIRIYEWQKTTFHAKTAVVDGTWASVGSYNMDRLSLMHNLEVNVAVESAEFASRVEEVVRRDLADSVEIHAEEWSRRPWGEKLVERFCHSLRFVL